MNIDRVLFFLFIVIQPAVAEVSIRPTVLLTAKEQGFLRDLIQEHEEAQKYWVQIKKNAHTILNDQPQPLTVIHYEGLLDTDPERVKTEKSLQDMDKLAVLLYAFYGTQDKIYAEKAKSMMLAWVYAYKATGNPINENKLEPLIHSYQVMKEYFSPAEKEYVNQWMSQIAEAEMAREGIPENNWKAKHIKLVGTIGLILHQQEYVRYAIDNFKAYVNKALYADGTSRDLHQRDALGYHVSGLKPLLAFAITLEQFGEDIQFDPFRYTSPEGGSIKKSVDYVIPFATGAKVHKEWVHTKVELDRQRAKAGLAHYQPGTHYDPKDSREMFEFAYYFNQDYKRIIQSLSEDDFKDYNSWFLVLLDVARKIN